MKYYASLTGPLLGVYFPLPIDGAKDMREARIVGGTILNTSKLKPLWCAVYDSDEVDKQIEEFGMDSLKLPDSYAGRIDYDWHAVYTMCQKTDIDIDEVIS